MKALTVKLADDIYERAEHRARERGETLPEEVADFVERYGQGTDTERNNGEPGRSGDVTRLFTALDAGRNVVSVAPLSRDELYDRPVLH